MLDATRCLVHGGIVHLPRSRHLLQCRQSRGRDVHPCTCQPHAARCQRNPEGACIHGYPCHEREAQRRVRKRKPAMFGSAAFLSSPGAGRACCCIVAAIAGGGSGAPAAASCSWRNATCRHEPAGRHPGWSGGGSQQPGAARYRRAWPSGRARTWPRSSRISRVFGSSFRTSWLEIACEHSASEWRQNMRVAAFDVTFDADRLFG